METHCKPPPSPRMWIQEGKAVVQHGGPRVRDSRDGKKNGRRVRRQNTEWAAGTGWQQGWGHSVCPYRLVPTDAGQIPVLGPPRPNLTNWSFRKQTLLLPQLWRPEARDPGAGRTMVPLQSPGRFLPASSSLCRLQQDSGLCLHWLRTLPACPCLFPSSKDTSCVGSGPTLLKQGLS